MAFAFSLVHPNSSGSAPAVGPGCYFSGFVTGVALTAGDTVQFVLSIASLSATTVTGGLVDPSSGYVQSPDTLVGIGEAVGGEAVVLTANYYAFGVFGPPQVVTIPGGWVYSPTSWLWQILYDMTGGGGTLDTLNTKLDAVLNAVRKTY